MKEEDPLRQLELAAYFTHCVLQPRHLALALRSAMTISFKLKCFQTCSHFCRRLIELNADEKMTVQARQASRGIEAALGSCTTNLIRYCVEVPGWRRHVPPLGFHSH